MLLLLSIFDQVVCDWLSMERIYGECQHHTATGRVSMTEPNLQNVPKDFDITLPGNRSGVLYYSEINNQLIQ